MTDIWTNDDDNSDNENCDQQEIESYLYSLVHHCSLEEECQQEHGENTLTPEEEDSTPAAQKTWRYFNAAPSRDEGDYFSKRFKQLSERYNSNNYRSNGLKLRKTFFWRRHSQSLQQTPYSVTTMEGMNNKVDENPPQVVCLESADSTNCENVSEIICTGDVERNDIQEKHSAPSSNENTCQGLAKASSNTEDTVVELDSCLSTSKENVERTNHNITQVPSQETVEIIDDLNNTNPSLSSFDDCFEPPSRPKSKSALNESMTQVLQVMLDEDASRSSIDSSDKRPPQKSKASSRPISGTGWTIGMSWEDMSSKFRFNFEVDSVCGDSVKEGSISTGSRANTPEGGVPMSPQDVSKYDVSLKTKNNPPDLVSMAIDNSDSEVDSVVEIVKPDKEPPPIVEILSDSEDIIPTKIKKVDKLQEIEEDIIILYETLSSAQNNDCAGDDIPHVVLNPLALRPPIASGPAKKRERHRKKAKQGKVATGRESDYGLGSVLATMSDDPNLWRICKEDMYPRPAARKYRPCDNCKQRDHFTSRCPEPVKMKVCYLCAEPGHSHYQCPNRMCLNCGVAARQVLRNCRLCSKKTVCDICLWSGHKSEQCPDLWRRYHMTTSNGPPVEPPPNFKVRSPTEMWCCNCARKGHISDTCPLLPSELNEKRLSYVVSYMDPTKGRGSVNRQPVSNTSLVPRNQASSSKSCLQANARATSKLPPPPNPPERQNRTVGSKSLLANFCNTPEFKNNYQLFSSKLQSIGLFPAEPLALANYLEKQLERLKKPVLSDRNVRFYYLQLMGMMKRDNISKHGLRRAFSYASQINMTVLGFGRLGEGNDLVNDLRSKIEQLRHLRTNKVPAKVRNLINEPFTQLFKGSIRKDLHLLVTEYLKRRGMGVPS